MGKYKYLVTLMESLEDTVHDLEKSLDDSEVRLKKEIERIEHKQTDEYFKAMRNIASQVVSDAIKAQGPRFADTENLRNKLNRLENDIIELRKEIHGKS